MCLYISVSLAVTQHTNIPEFFVVPLIVLDVEIRVPGSLAVIMAPSITVSVDVTVSILVSVDVTVSIPVFVAPTPFNPVVSFLYKKSLQRDK